MDHMKEDLDKIENLCSLYISNADNLLEIYNLTAHIKMQIKMVEEWIYEKD